MTAVQIKSFLPTGIPDLDERLGGGWFCGAISELSGRAGGGKTTLAARTLTQLSRAKRPVVFIGGEESLFPPGLVGANLDFLLWLRPPKNERQIWALEQVVRSGLFSLVVASGVRIDEKPLRRIQLSAEKSQSAILLLRSQPSTSGAWALAFQCGVQRKSQEVLKMDVLKSRRPILGRTWEVYLDHEPTHSRALSTQTDPLRAVS